jgi:uncharacterized membrane protein YhhN
MVGRKRISAALEKLHDFYMNFRGVLNALIFISAIIAIVLDYHESSLYNIFKPLTTVLVIVWVIMAKEVDTYFKRTIILALCFCLFGDILLLKNDYFVFGLGAFLLGHLLFAKAFVGLHGFQRNPIVALVLLAIGIGLFDWLYPDLGALKYPVAAYVLVILFMAWQGIGLYLREKTTAYGFIALGVILFMLSDSMIAIDRFKSPFELSGVVILSTYWLAITLIANGSSMRTKRVYA